MVTNIVAPALLSRICAALFVGSAMFPIAASVYPADAPRWVGFADVGFAALLLAAVISLTLQMQNRVRDDDKLTAFRISQRFISVIPLLLVLFFIAGGHVKWEILVIGLAWRAWLLLYSLPYLVTARRTSQSGSRHKMAT